ncbi:MAG: hypothetical protein EOL87_09350 [Spartobacteria bacterium]|nr:hypothetical protein [Spartobacteria bacterium]
MSMARQLCQGFCICTVVFFTVFQPAVSLGASAVCRFVFSGSWMTRWSSDGMMQADALLHTLTEMREANPAPFCYFVLGDLIKDVGLLPAEAIPWLDAALDVSCVNAWVPGASALQNGLVTESDFAVAANVMRPQGLTYSGVFDANGFCVAWIGLASPGIGYLMGPQSLIQVRDLHAAAGMAMMRLRVHKPDMIILLVDADLNDPDVDYQMKWILREFSEIHMVVGRRDDGAFSVMFAGDVCRFSAPSGGGQLAWADFILHDGGLAPEYIASDTVNIVRDDVRDVYAVISDEMKAFFDLENELYGCTSPTDDMTALMGEKMDAKVVLWGSSPVSIQSLACCPAIGDAARLFSNEAVDTLSLNRRQITTYAALCDDDELDRISGILCQDGQTSLRFDPRINGRKRVVVAVFRSCFTEHSPATKYLRQLALQPESRYQKDVSCLWMLLNKTCDMTASVTTMNQVDYEQSE